MQEAAALEPSASCSKSSKDERWFCKPHPDPLGSQPVEAVQGQGCSSLCLGLSPPALLLHLAVLAHACLAPSPWHQAMGRWFMLL